MESHSLKQAFGKTNQLNCREYSSSPCGYIGVMSYLYRKNEAFIGPPRCVDASYMDHPFTLNPKFYTLKRLNPKTLNPKIAKP